MNCQNCRKELSEYCKFCNLCGAKVVQERITVKNLWVDVFQNSFGWDNKFFFTIKMLVARPAVLLREYLNGTRKKYVNPFTILALTSALSLFIFNFFVDDYMALNMDSNRQTTEMMSKIMEKQFGEDFDTKRYKEETLAMVTTYSTFVLKYFNLLVVLLIPVYSFMAFLVFRKPYNYAEHLVINCYIQSLTFLLTCVFFVLSIITDPSVYLGTVLFTVSYYTYAYGKLYRLTVAEAILKFLIFLGVLVIALIILFVLTILIALLAAKLKA